MWMNNAEASIVLEKYNNFDEQNYTIVHYDREVYVKPSPKK